MSAWTPEVGKPCSFYHEGGGNGEKHWVVGWRYGIIRHVPARGQHYGWVRIEIPVDAWAFDYKTRRWSLKPRVLVWVHSSCVNEVGDTIYHGPRTVEVLAERKEAKRREQEKADKKRAAGRRFHR